MIKYIKRLELDVEKYDLCIENATNTRIYAFSYYLDIVADNWGVLVLGDYKAVMPLPWRSKYWVKYIYTPCWTQQLGVFSSDGISVELIQYFIKNIPKKFKKVTIHFNSENQFSGEDIVKKINYVLSLNEPYKALFANYKKARRRKIKSKKTIKFEISESLNSQEIIQLFIQQKQKEVGIKKTDYSKLEELIKFLIRINNVDILVAKNSKEELLGGAFFLKDTDRITYLFSSISQKGRDAQVMAYIIDDLIKKHANSNLILDFEGSMIPGIAFFFRSFGAEEEMYATYEKPSIY